MAMSLPAALRDRAKRDLLLPAVIVYAIGLGIFLLRHLDRLSLWMDEGFHWLAVRGILDHGIPLFPSGHVYYKAILYCYVLAGAALLFGFTTATLRAVSVVAFAAAIPVVYLVGRKFASRAVGLGAAVLLSLSIWGVEYARVALYFAQLVLLCPLALLLFWRGYVEERRAVRPWVWVLFLALPLIHQLGVGVWFAFAGLFVIRGPRRFFRRDVLIFAAATALFYAAIQLHEFFFWQVGYVYERTDTSLAGLLRYFFAGFSLDYFWEFERSFQVMSAVVLAGLAASLTWFAVERLPRRRPQMVAENGTAPSFGQADRATSAASKWLFLNLALVLPLLMLGFFRTHVQPRYLMFLYPLFLVLFLMPLDRASRLIARAAAWPVEKLFGRRKASALQDTDRTGTPAGTFGPAAAVRTAVALVVFAGLTVKLVQGVGWSKVEAAVERKYQDRIRSDVLTRSGRLAHEDYRTTGEFVRRFLRDDDVVVAIHVVFSYIYAGRVDYWLWTGGPGTWDAWEETPDGWRDFYVGARWLNSLEALRAVTEGNPGRRVWVITSPSIDKWDHISGEVAGYIRSDPARLAFLGRDGVSGVYIWNDDEGLLTGPRPAFEAEWLHDPPGRIEYRPDASRQAALVIGADGEVPDRARVARPAPEQTFAARLPGVYGAGRYTCTVRLAAGGAGGAAEPAPESPPSRKAGSTGALNETVLSVGVFLGPQAERVRAYAIGRGDLAPGGGFQDVAFDFYLPRDGRLELRFTRPGTGTLRLDAIDVKPSQGE